MSGMETFHEIRTGFQHDSTLGVEVIPLYVVMARGHNVIYEMRVSWNYFRVGCVSI